MSDNSDPQPTDHDATISNSSTPAVSGKLSEPSEPVQHDWLEDRQRGQSESLEQQAAPHQADSANGNQHGSAVLQNRDDGIRQTTFVSETNRDRYPLSYPLLYPLFYPLSYPFTCLNADPYEPPKSIWGRSTDGETGPYHGVVGNHESHPAIPTRPGVDTDVYSEDRRAWMPESLHSVPALRHPLRVIHVGQCLVRAGIERWLMGLLRFSSRERLNFLRCVVTSPLYDPEVVRELPVPVEVGGRDSVRRAARDCDILLVSGPAEVGGWLADCRPRLCVGVAHGTAIWSRQVLEGCRPVLDHVVAVSRAVQRSVCEGFSSSVIYNGIDTEHLAPSLPRHEIRAKYGLTPNDFVLGSVMRFSVEKHPEVLIEAIARLPQHYKLLLVGWGNLRTKLLNLANDLAPLRCILTPAEKHVGDYYRAFDAFCLPSFSEGFGLATLEAMFCGLPAITTRTGFAPELLEEGVQYLACESQPEAIARAVQRLADYPHWAATIAREGQQRAEQFGFATRMCREYEATLLHLWQTRQASSPR
jgi:glycosyltransferase involved in cell wall biosynthesis